MGKRKQRPGGRRPGGRSTDEVAGAVLRAAAAVCRQLDAACLLLHVDGIRDRARLSELAEACPCRLVLLSRWRRRNLSAELPRADVLQVPPVRLGRIDQLRMGVLLAFSSGLLHAGETFVGLTGLAGGPVDSLIVMTAGREWELFSWTDQPPITEHVRRAVFQRVVTLAVQLAAEGREGRPVGALFIIGPPEEVLRYADQMILNPFQSHPAASRNVLDESLVETVREYASLDGAFLVRGDGQVVSAGLYLRPPGPGAAVPAGLGARHASAAGITAAINCLAVTISQSSGAVRVWRHGRMVMEIRRGAMPGRRKR